MRTHDLLFLILLNLLKFLVRLLRRTQPSVFNAVFATNPVLINNHHDSITLVTTSTPRAFYHSDWLKDNFWMAAAATNAGIPPLEVPAPAYNIPLNLSSILSMIPGSRFIGRLRKGANGLEPLEVSEPSSTIIETLAAQASMLATQVTKQQLYEIPQPQQQQIPPPFPGPWEFFTSGYIVGLFIMVCFLGNLFGIHFAYIRNAFAGCPIASNAKYCHSFSA